METIDRATLKEKAAAESVTLVNVLSAEQFEEEHIPGSINIPLDEIEDRAREELSPDEEIVVYCASASCQASPKAVKKLEDMGFSDVADYEGGLADWTAAGLPTVTGE